MHAMINPVIYITLNEKFRQEFTKAVVFGKTASTESKMIFKILAFFGGCKIVDKNDNLSPKSDPSSQSSEISPYFGNARILKEHNSEVPSL